MAGQGKKEVYLSESKKELKEYIEKSVSRGIPKETVKKSLLDSGWPGKIVDLLFDRQKPRHPGKDKQHGNLFASQFTGSVPSGSSIISFINVSKSFGDNKVLENVNLEVKHGEILGIIGLSGSGKTTLLNTLIGFLYPDEGDVLYRLTKTREFHSVFKKLLDVKQNFGFASQEPSFYPKLTPEENLDHFGSLYNIPSKIREEKVKSLLGLMGLMEGRDTLSQNISGGMQKRLSIACSLIHNPPVLILDEPTADLDPFLRQEMYSLIRKINERGVTIILTTHLLSEMEDVCTRIGILHEGRIIETGTPDELKKRYSKNEEIIIETASADYDIILKELRRQEEGIEKISKEGRKAVIYTPRAETVLHRLLHLIEKFDEKLLSVDVNKPSLREVFESLVKK